MDRSTMQDTLTESERPGQERVDGPEQQRLTNHSIELRVEKAVYAKLKADYETGTSPAVSSLLSCVARNLLERVLP